MSITLRNYQRSCVVWQPSWVTQTKLGQRMSPLLFIVRDLPSRVDNYTWWFKKHFENHTSVISWQRKTSSSLLIPNQSTSWTLYQSEIRKSVESAKLDLNLYRLSVCHRLTIQIWILYLFMMLQPSKLSPLQHVFFVSWEYTSQGYT